MVLLSGFGGIGDAVGWVLLLLLLTLLLLLLLMEEVGFELASPEMYQIFLYWILSRSLNCALVIRKYVLLVEILRIEFIFV